MRGAANYIKSTGKQDLVCAEIGVRLGENAVDMLCGLPIKTLSLVDPYVQYFDYTFFLDQECQDAYYMEMLKNIEAHTPRVTIYKETSENASKKFADNSLDFVYIDGCHSVNAVSLDLSCWWRTIKQNGFLCGHDFWFAGVRAALHPFVASRAKSITVFNDSDWLITKEL